MSPDEALNDFASAMVSYQQESGDDNRGDVGNDGEVSIFDFIIRRRLNRLYNNVLYFSSYLHSL